MKTKLTKKNSKLLFSLWAYFLNFGDNDLRFKDKQNKIDRCGFLYELNGKDETFEEQFLSDGENGFMSRYALL